MGWRALPALRRNVHNVRVSERAHRHTLGDDVPDRSPLHARDEMRRHKHHSGTSVVEVVEVEVFQPELPERVGVEAHLLSEPMTHTDERVSGGAGLRVIGGTQGLGPGSWRIPSGCRKRVPCDGRRVISVATQGAYRG